MVVFEPCLRFAHMAVVIRLQRKYARFNHFLFQLRKVGGTTGGRDLVEARNSKSSEGVLLSSKLFGDVFELPCT